MEKQEKQNILSKTDFNILSNQMDNIQLQVEEIKKQTKNFELSQATSDIPNKSITEIKEIIEKNNDIKLGDKEIILSQIDNISSKLLILKAETEAQQIIDAMRQYINNKSSMVKRWLLEADEYLDQKLESQAALNEATLIGLTHPNPAGDEIPYN